MGQPGPKAASLAGIECPEHSYRFGLGFSQYDDVDPILIGQFRHHLSKWFAIDVPEQKPGAWQRKILTLPHGPTVPV